MSPKEKTSDARVDRPHVSQQDCRGQYSLLGRGNGMLETNDSMSM